MKYRRRIYYSAAQRAEIWDRWQRGESMSSIGRRFDRESSSVFSVISPTGGIRPADRTRGSRALSLGEREEISRGLTVKHSLRAIARQLGRAPSTISRLSPVPEPHSIGEAAAQVVARANCRLVETDVSRRGAKAGVTRDDISKSVHSGSGRPEEGVA